MEIVVKPLAGGRADAQAYFRVQFGDGQGHQMGRRMAENLESDSRIRQLGYRAVAVDDPDTGPLDFRRGHFTFTQKQKW